MFPSFSFGRSPGKGTEKDTVKWLQEKKKQQSRIDGPLPKKDSLS